MDREEQLKSLKRKLLDKQNKVDSMIFELREINESLSKMKNHDHSLKKLDESILLLKEEINNIKNETNIGTVIESAEISGVEFPEYPKEMKISNLNEIVLPEEKVIHFPETIKVSNLDEIKSESMRISNLDEIKNIKIDWENAPKQDGMIVQVGKQIKTLENAIEEVLKAFFNKVYIFFDKIIEYIKEPDRIIVSDKEITEWYGTKKTKYRIKDDGIKIEITREN